MAKAYIGFTYVAMASKEGSWMKSMLIYVAGPYTGATRIQIDKNVNCAIDAGVKIYLKGHFPYVPHLTDLVDKRAKETGNELSWEDFIRWDMPWLQACDALLYLAPSKGADLELGEAKRLGKRIFFSIDEIEEVPWQHRTADEVA